MSLRVLLVEDVEQCLSHSKKKIARLSQQKQLRYHKHVRRKSIHLISDLENSFRVIFFFFKSK
jgi:hypothetical protein